MALLLSGMGLSQAFKQAGRVGPPRRNPLAREAVILSRELEAGRDRSTAFAALAERTGVKDIERLAAVLSVGLRVGAPISGPWRPSRT